MPGPTAGIVLPSHRIREESTRDYASELRRTADAAAEAGADTLWVWDHMLRAPVYREPWHDPLVSLAAVADVGLRLGTGILVAPLRLPVQTATAVSTLQSLSGKPMRLGVGTGWNPTEFAASGMRTQERGERTDEFLSILDATFAGEQDFSGKFYAFEGVDPGELGPPPDIWIAGGSRVAGRSQDAQQSTDGPPRIATNVARRILRYGRWLIRPSATLEDYQRDRDALDESAGDLGVADKAGPLSTSIITVGHIVETDDPDAARREQLTAFHSLMHDNRPLEYLERCYLIGTLDEIRARLESWVDVGLEHIGLYLLGDVPSQIALFRKHFDNVLDLGVDS